MSWSSLLVTELDRNVKNNFTGKHSENETDGIALHRAYTDSIG